MTTAIDAVQARRVLGRKEWGAPTPFGPGWKFVHATDPAAGSVIITPWDLEDDGIVWLHASISRGEQMPSYEDLRALHRAVWGTTGYAYEVHAPDSQHVNIHPNARHLWGRADGKPVLPEFGRFGTI